MAETTLPKPGDKATTPVDDGLAGVRANKHRLGQPSTLLVRPVIMALDLGTHTGWAIRARDGAITSGTVTFHPGRFEGAGMTFLRFRAWLNETAALVHGIDQVDFEEVRAHAGTTAAHVYGGFLAILTA